MSLNVVKPFLLKSKHEKSKESSSFESTSITVTPLLYRGGFLLYNDFIRNNLMTDQFTLEQAAELVEFRKYIDGEWHVDTVKGNCRIVEGNCDIIEGDCRIVEGHVYGTINGRQWQYVETPKEKLQRLIEEGANKEQLLEAINQLKDN